MAEYIDKQAFLDHVNTALCPNCGAKMDGDNAA